MNYCELSDFETKEKEHLSIISSNNNPQVILDDFDILNTSLIEYKSKKEDLLTKNNYFINYMTNSQNSHLNVMNIINDYHINMNMDDENNLSNMYANYNLTIRNNYKKWLSDYYTPQMLSIENNIEIIENKINEFRNLFIFIINKILRTNEINDKKLCPICFENEIDMCINPCGHTLCNRCIISNRNNTNRCYSCRGHISDYIRIYFSV